MAGTEHGQEDPQSSSDFLARIDVFVSLLGIGLSTILATVAVQERLGAPWFGTLLFLGIALTLSGGVGSIYSLVAGKRTSVDKSFKRAFSRAWKRPSSIAIGALTSFTLIASLLFAILRTATPLATEHPSSNGGLPVGDKVREPSGAVVPSSPNTLIWGQLPTFTVSGPTLFEQSLTTPKPGWPVGRSDIADVEFKDGAYMVHPRSYQYGKYIAAPAPPETFLSDIVVTATASLQSGQGSWGVWCRGVDDPGDAYLFLISHAGAVQITLTGFNGDGTGWKYLEGVDVSKPITISARCADIPGYPVLLTMAVNGREVLNYRPVSNCK